MHLERVELEGFKSFTRRAEVSFCPHFTVITGPNGSGKSNILDAVCFALTEDERHLRVKSWAELVSTEPSVEKASVVLTFVEHGRDKTRLSATVKKSDGARVFKLQDARKTVREVRLWLKSCGLDIEGHSNILQQNTVVSLADKTPGELAAMVMAASGGAVFDSMIETVNSNVAKAEEEKRHTEAKIQQFQRDIGEDSETMKLIDDQEQIAAEVARKQQALAAAEWTAVCQEETKIKHQMQNLEMQRGSAQCSLQSVGSITHTQAQERLDVELKESERQHGEYVDQLRSNQELQAEEAEEERALSAQLAEEQAEHEATKRTLNSLMASKKLMAARQVEVYDELARNDTDLQRLSELLHTPQGDQHSAARIELLRSSLAAQQHDLTACTSKRQQIQKLLKQHAAQLARCHAAQKAHSQAIVQLRTDAVSGVHLSEEEITRKLSTIDVTLETVRHQIQAASDMVPIDAQREGPSCLLKHCCFSTQAERYLDALGEIAGAKLQAVVVRDTSAATQLLQESRPGTVVWPLDRLKVNTTTTEEALVASAARECEGEALLPSDILSFTGPLTSLSDVPFKRVFGGWAISTTARATKHLIRKGVRVCELNGTKHVPGTVSGGFFGHRQRRNSIRAEFELHKEQAARKALELKATALATEHSKLKRQLLAFVELSSALEKEHELQVQQAECESKISTCEAEVGELERSERLLAQQVAMSNTELSNRLTQDETTVQLGLKEAQTNLQVQNEGLAAELSRLSSDLQQADADENQLTERLRTTATWSNTAIDDGEGNPTSLQHEIAQHQLKRKELQEVENCIRIGIEDSAACCREVATKIKCEREKAAAADQKHHGLQRKLQNIARQLQSNSDRLQVLAAKKAGLVNADPISTELQCEVSVRIDAPGQGGESSAGVTRGDVDTSELRVEVKVLEQRREALLEKLSGRSGSITDIDLSALAAKQNQLSEFLHKRGTIDTAINKLKEEIAASENKKNIANQKAFHTISATFAEYFATLAPSKEAQLRIGSSDDPASVSDVKIDLSMRHRNGSARVEAIDQVHFVVRTRRAAASNACPAVTSLDCSASAEAGEDADRDDARCTGCPSSSGWKSSTSELSGGQRTLLGLAFVLSIAKYQPSPVYVLDEVDAALDEGNQARVASLVAQVLGHEQRCQTIAISHHADFQRGAARVVEICKKPELGSCVANCFDRVPC